MFASIAVRKKNVSDNRRTRFSAGQGLEKFLIAETTEIPIVTRSKREEAVQTIPPIPLKVNLPDATPTRPLPEEKINIRQREQPSRLEIKDPWDTYTALRSL